MCAAAVEEAAAIIRAGGLVAFPTETVYGLGADALNTIAVGRIYVAKGRPAFNPLIVHVDDVEGVRTVARHVPPMAEALAEVFWPGPLTLVLPKRPLVPDAVTAGLDSVAVRVPAHAVARMLIACAQRPIAAPSANASTRVSPTTAAHVVQQLGASLDLILDGGPTSVGIESTVVDLTGPRPVLLRPGGIPRDAIERVVGELVLVSSAARGDVPLPSPGMMERHYAPQAQLVAFDAEERDDIAARIAAHERSGGRAALLAHDVDDVTATCVLSMPRDSEAYARKLYAALHTIDDAQCDLAFVERVPFGVQWDAVRDRLRRAGVAGDAG
ncbi:MAG: L-threonylcarbamoyladenylate synthase [Gemmatimonadaceae bacterium]